MLRNFDKTAYFLICYLFCWCRCLNLVAPFPASFGPTTRNAPVVNTSLGYVRGIVDYSRQNRHYYQYLGLPYAEAPIGDLRFEAPVPLKKRWNGIRQADSWGAPCLQFDAVLRGRILGEEDCLFMNIFTPSINPTKLQPVMVWVHGGGFVAGSSDMYDPKYFMDYNMVVVTMNYRLASLGFLNTGDEHVRGNMGLKDQNLVLKFVKKNILNFGGDRNNVTLFGESAGGASVHYHVISPLSKGLFHRAIMQSGNVFCPWAHTRSPEKQALKFGKSVGCPTDNTTILTKCLKKMDGKSIVRQHQIILSPVHSQDDFFPGSVEAVKKKDTFLADNPFMMLKRGEFNHVPVIFGMNSAEGALKTARLEATPEVMNALDVKWDEHVAVLLHYNPEMKNVSTKIRHYYCPRSFPPFDPKYRSNSSSENERSIRKSLETIPPQNALENVTDMLSDGVWFHATKQAAAHHSKYAPVYLNYFSYHSDILPSTYTFIKSARVRNNIPAEFTWPRYLAEAYFGQYFMQSRNHKRFGACHGDDLMYYWNTNPVVQIRTVSRDYQFSTDFVKSLSDFVGGEREMRFGNVSWEPVNSTGTFRYMRLDRDGQMIDQPYEDRIAFIDSLHIRDPLDPNNW